MCELCGAQFARSEYRARHIASAHYKENSCKICFRIFPNNNELQMHMILHTKKKVEETGKIRSGVQKPIKPIASISYERSLMLRKHECDICQRRFIRKQHMMRHRDTHADIRRYQCVCCRKRFSRREYHEKHQTECAKKFNQLCPETGQTFDSISVSEGSTGHRMEEDDDDEDNGGDDDGGDDDGGDNGNVSSNHGIDDSILNNIGSKIKNELRSGKIYPCDVCERVFTRSDHLKRHKDTHINFRPYNCAYCHRLFSRKENQKRHESLCKLKIMQNGISQDASINSDFGENSMVNGSDNGFNDDEIGEPSLINDLDIDVTNKTVLDSDGVLSVEGNGSVFTIITGPKKLRSNSCPICSREFARSDHLKRHIQTHDGIKRYQCQCCRKFFARQDYQVKHEKTCMTKFNYSHSHSGNHKLPLLDDFWKMSGMGNDSEDVASIADNTLNDDFEMNTLPNVENEFDNCVGAVDSPETKYVMPELSKKEYTTLSCDTCARFFQKRHHLRRHKISHLDRKPFECTDCDRKFTRPEHMRSHLLTRHNKIIKNRGSSIERGTDKFLIKQPTLRKKCIHRFADFAKNFTDTTSTNYYERCFDFVASMVIAHEKRKFALPSKPTHTPLYDRMIKNEPDAEPSGLFINVEGCSDPLELYDENDDINL